MPSTNLESKLQVASNFLLQSPPGEVNDVFNDVRALVSDDQALEQGILPALEQYNKQQFIVVDLPSNDSTVRGGRPTRKALVTQASKLAQVSTSDTPGLEKHLDPRSSQSFLFDHMKVTASNLESIQTDPETEHIRSSLDKLLDAYVQNHYADGVSAVYALDDPAYPPPEPVREQVALPEEVTAAATAPDSAVEDGESGADSADTSVETSAPAVADEETATPTPTSVEEQVETSEPVNRLDERQAEDKTEEEPTPSTSATAEEDSTMNEATPGPQDEIVTEEEAQVEGEPEAAATQSTQEMSTAISAPTPAPRPSRQFGVYFVGNKYNPSNYWTGRWRSRYQVDWKQGTIQGEIVVNVHYYEQGNVQLDTTIPVSTTFTQGNSDDVNSSSSLIVAAIKRAESEFVTRLNDAFDELSNDMFRGLRRALPKTKQKLDWTKVGAYRVGSQASGVQ